MIKKLFLLLLSPFIFCACEPLYFSVYVRNFTKNPVGLTWMVKERPAGSWSGLTPGERGLTVSCRRELLTIGKNTRKQMTDSLSVLIADDHTVRLIIPPYSTVCLSDLFRVFGRAGENTLVMTREGVTDTTRFDYPYRKTRGFVLKRDAWYHVFYRTMLYYDIR